MLARGGYQEGVKWIAGSSESVVVGTGDDTRTEALRVTDSKHLRHSEDLLNFVG